MTTRYVLVFTPADANAPKSIRTWTLEAAQVRASTLNRQDADAGTWTVHELGEPTQ